MKKFLHYLVLSLMALFTVGPFIWLVTTALRGSNENVFNASPIPASPTLEHFGAVWGAVPFGQYFWNSVVVAVLSVLLNVLLSAMAAYPLARMEFKGKNWVFWAILATMMVPAQVTMIPLFLICLKLHLTDTYWGMVLPTAVSAFGIFLLRQAYQSVPKELEEAAIVDGCNHFDVWWRIMVPLIKPSLATLAIFVFVGSWGEFLWPLIVVKDPNLYTLPVGIAALAGTFAGNWRLVAAGSVLSIIPIVIFFAFLQRYFIGGATAGAVKG